MLLASRSAVIRPISSSFFSFFLSLFFLTPLNSAGIRGKEGRRGGKGVRIYRERIHYDDL